MEKGQYDYLQLNITLNSLASFNTKGLIRWGVGIAAFALLALLLYVMDAGPVLYFSVGWLALISLLLWIGNRFLTKRLDKSMPWTSWGNVRFFTQLSFGLAYLLVLINATYYGIKTQLTGSPPSDEQLLVANAWGSIIFVPVFSIYFSLHFLRHWRKSELEMARYQKENMKSQLDSLKSHLDPHFLFNNLNILAALIDKNKEASKEFIHKFAEVYRSMLKSKSDDLILVSEEMDFIEAYIFLIKTRFEENIQFEISIKDTKNKALPPLTIQMLVENAIKHNVINENVPLVISMKEDGEYLVVSNTVNKSAEQVRSGTGLKNIQRRYAHFTDKPVDIREADGIFEVRIPLLEIEHA